MACPINSSDGGPTLENMDATLTTFDTGSVIGAGTNLVGSLAVPVEPWSQDMSAVDADTRFQRDAMSAALVAVGPPTGVAVLTRTQVHMQMTGPRGYGRALHTRSTVRDLLGPHTLVLPADATVVEGAHAALHRPPEARYDDIAVCWSDGQMGLLPVSALMEELAKEFATVALHDPLTRLPNRAALRQRMETCELDRLQYAVLLLDLDGFKRINDLHGHHAGDEVLIETARRLRTIIGAEDLVVRLGGDEFVIFVSGRAEPASVEELAHAVLSRLAVPILLSAQLTATVGVSVGVVVIRPGEAAATEALKAADIALYDAKRSGKGQARWGRPASGAPRLPAASINLPPRAKRQAFNTL